MKDPNSAALRFVNQDGEVKVSTDAIFPIFKHSIGSIDDLELMGTGFYIASNGLFITASHVFHGDDNTIDTSKSFSLMHQLPEDIYQWRPIQRSWNSEVADIAVGVSAPMTQNDTGAALVNSSMTLTAERPPVGSEISTYSFSGSEVNSNERKTKVDLRPHFYSGKLFEYFPDGRDKVKLTWPVYETNLNIQGAASGGPVVSERGTVFAINTSSFEGATDISYVTPIDLALDGRVDDISIDGHAATSISVRGLARRGIISFKPDYPTR